MAIGTVLSRVTGFGRILALAYAVGFIGLGDAYNLANVTPNIVYELVLGGVLSGTLVTVFVRQLALDDASAPHALSAVTTVAMVAAGVLGVGVALAAPLVIGAYTFGDAAVGERAVATTLLRWFAPQVALLAAITLTTALLNARRRFAAPMFAPVATNLVIIAVLLAAPVVADDLSLQGAARQPGLLAVLGLGTTLAYAVQAVVQVAALRGTGLRLRPRWDPRHPLVREVVRLSFWTVGFTVANQVALWVVLVLANRRPGGVSAWQAAVVFFQLPHAVITVSLAAALQPTLAEAWAREDHRGFARDAAWGLRTMAALVVPAAAGYAVLAAPVVRLALEHGALEAQAASLTADVLRALALGLPGYSAFLFLVRALMAQRDLRSVFWLYVVENAVNVVLAVALFPAFGVPGLAASYAIAYLVAAALALRRLGRVVRAPLAGPMARPLARTAGAATVMAGTVVIVSSAIGGTGGARLVVRVVASVVAGVTVYLLSARAAGIDEIRDVLRGRLRPATTPGRGQG
jgi:putative peptidoglycan lipid II flippase